MYANLRRAWVIAIAILATAPLWGDDYDRYYVRISIDQIKMGYQRGKSPDHDYLTLYATSTHDPGSRVTTGPIDIGTFQTNDASTPSPNPMTDELLVGDRDTIQIFADIQNKSHTDPSKAVSDGLKIAGATITVLGAGELLAATATRASWTQFLNKEGGVTTLVGAALALGGEVIGDVGGWLGLSDPDCDGPVFAPQSPVLVNVGKFMGRFQGPIPLNTPLGLMLWTDESQQNGDGCGHPPSATIRVNLVLSRPPFKVPDLTQSFGPPTHFKPIATAVKAENLAGTTWADRSFIEGSRVQVTAKAVKTIRSYHSYLINSSSIGPSSAPSSTSGRAYFQHLRQQNPQVLELLGQPPKIHSVSLVNSSPDIAFDVHENAAPGQGSDVQISGASSILMPMQATAFLGNKFPMNEAIRSAASGVRFTESGAVPVVKTAPSATSANTSWHRGNERYELLPVKGELFFADSVALPNNVIVQLYGAYDAQERFAGNRLRYMRLDSNGNVVTDVMLEPAQHVPR